MVHPLLQSISETEKGIFVILHWDAAVLLIMRNRQHVWEEFQEDMQIESARVDLF